MGENNWKFEPKEERKRRDGRKQLEV